MDILIPASIEKVPCRACQFVGAIKWNSDNQVLQCHNCGKIAEYTGFYLTVIGIALHSEDFHKELEAFNTALHKFITEYPGGTSLLPAKVTFTHTRNPFETTELYD